MAKQRTYWLNEKNAVILAFFLALLVGFGYAMYRIGHIDGYNECVADVHHVIKHVENKQIQ